MQREQKTTKVGYRCEGMLETESNSGARSIVTPETAEKDGASRLLEAILHRDNLNAAYLRVKRNGGAPGVDGMAVEEMLPYLKDHKEELLASIRAGWYNPKPVRRVEIPKPDGGKRNLGVPTVIDRMVQQAVVQVMQPMFEPHFSENSYGFRPGRSAHQAMKKAEEYYKQGYIRVVDIDLAKYFDTVNHDILIDRIREVIKDEHVIKLIRKFLKSGVMANGLVSPTTEGTPQGGNLSPLLSNIYLTAFDRMLESRGHKFVRYADDCNIYVKSQRAAERVMTSSTKYLENKLKLKVNQEKSKAGSPLKLKFLGFSLFKTGKRMGIRPHAKSMEKFKNKIRQLTSRKQAKPIPAILNNIRKYTTGWLGYYAIAEMSSKIKSLNEWIRRRIRQIFWKQWKKPSAKFKNLMLHGIPKQKAREWSYSRLGYWRIAGSWILCRSLTNEYLASIGYDDIAKRYEVLHLSY
ncbi:group II intron reverse transcriptase/maturase [Sporomusa sphaeroides]|uniref:Group II intron-encoded protein LtrA n=2 Tax=Sporomusa TaxID=2375 RepID=A0ABM9WA31_9FIRM|nr:group II intron reverse transcriptase/maturase [Sporomusa sphaeroides]OLS54650.1 group II intron-encoded protein LtrA [Sporomusa sphaeroides DSM 2875]OLS54963.1 group II intron-encoded protein LtrA [Sporomusa sphaeroides DSM 2875]OLS56968.1 group II intron-encoded protein LtrA [Sporomusa sphaeroides DSM 2875]OLS57279.1 group II intron-encoded protein LtrA [Sporomusa sphaeroides DSM 2875]CVK21925.1 Group II intron-encoded protein LtrA [Sporomusa sphaeroides DSM 2875]